MNIPVGTLKIQGKTLSANSITNDISDFMAQGRIGYICVTIKGEHGVQEGMLIIENGLLIGSHYEYLSLEKRFNAREALERTLNAFYAVKGVYDSYELTVQQIELLKIFNEDMLFLEALDQTALQGMIPMQFSAQYEKDAIEEKEKTKKDLIDERGLTEVEIDNYQRVRDQMSHQITTPEATSKVEEGVNSYLMGKPPREEPKEAPIVEEEKIAKKIVLTTPPPPPRENLANLDEKAKELLKGLEKRNEE